MLKAFEMGADGIFIGESEEKSSPYPHSVAAIKENVATVRAALKDRNIDPERVRFVEFVTVMLGAFVKHMNDFSDFARRSGPVNMEESDLLADQLAKQE
jgi:coenzyme F420-reducing hydrogenase delta subunit